MKTDVGPSLRVDLIGVRKDLGRPFLVISTCRGPRGTGGTDSLTRRVVLGPPSSEPVLEVFPYLKETVLSLLFRLIRMRTNRVLVVPFRLLHCSGHNRGKHRDERVRP